MSGRRDIVVGSAELLKIPGEDAVRSRIRKGRREENVYSWLVGTSSAQKSRTRTSSTLVSNTWTAAKCASCAGILAQCVFGIECKHEAMREALIMRLRAVVLAPFEGANHVDL